ncbi:hypothetical protein V5738_05825 [Salinisphaera sp. SPP-AMP-43]|uniref:hypothetical protein n=1 Tax=Salinisphaera sp. SPP-AMP-43 TaxID=3121288 RepID=UPI003C6DF5F1
MPAWVYDQGHIGWVLFSALVYTGVLFLVADYLWRRVTMSSRRLAIAVGLVWLVGIFVMLAWP